jgi:hypothetical protein
MQSALAQVREWAARAQARAAETQSLADAVARVTATARDRSGAITVTVDATGALVGLEFGDGIREFSPARLAEQVMQTVRAAQANLVAAVDSAVVTTVGADSPIRAAVIDNLERRFGRPADDGRSQA